MNDYIGKLAWSCWNEGDSLSHAVDSEKPLDLEENWSHDLKVENGILWFSSRDVLLRYASTYVFNEIILPNNDNDQVLFEQLYDIWRKDLDKSENLSGRVLAMAHNTGQLDFMSFASNSIPHAHSVFEVIHVMEKAFPLVDAINLDSLFHFAKISYDKLKGDMMGGRIYQVLVDWLKEHPAYADNIIQIHINDPQENSASLFKSALLSIGEMRPDEAVELVLSYASAENRFISDPAIQAIGHFQYTLPAHQKTYDVALKLVEEILRIDHESQVGTAATALTYLVRQHPSNHASLKLLTRSRPEALYALSEFLFLNVQELGEREWFKYLLMECIHTTPAQKGIIDNLDWVVSSFLKKDDTKLLAIQFLEDWLQAQTHEKSINIDLEALFNNTVYEILNGQHLSFIFTKWMSSSSTSLNQGAFELLRTFETTKGTSLVYDMGFINAMDVKELDLLARRTLGYIYQEDILHSLIWSLTLKDKLDKQILSLVETIFIIHIGYDYPGRTYTFITEKTRGKISKKLKDMGKRIHLSINKYQNALDDLPRLKELVPPHSKIRQFRMAQQNAMEKATEKAEEKSVFRQLVTQIPLKAGLSTFSRNRGEYSEKMQLGSYSHYVSLPRSEVIDPVGSNRRRLLYRTQK